MCDSEAVLSSNEHLIRVGAEVAKRDVDDCIERGQAAPIESGDSSTGNVVAGTASSTVVGAAAGGAGGAVVGQAGQGAAAGAVGGVVAGLMQALIQGLFQAKPPQPSTQQFVDGCLRQKGYEPTGWK